MATSQQQPTGAASEEKKKARKQKTKALAEDEPETESTEQRLHRLELQLQEVNANNKWLEQRVETLEDKLGVDPPRVQLVDSSELAAVKAKASAKRKAQTKDKSGKSKKAREPPLIVVDYTKTDPKLIDFTSSHFFIA